MPLGQDGDDPRLCEETTTMTLHHLQEQLRLAKERIAHLEKEVDLLSKEPAEAKPEPPTEAITTEEPTEA
jgi:hypothetical protein